jgi:hypothetical protein
MNKANEKNVTSNPSMERGDFPLGQNMGALLNMQLPSNVIILGGGLAILLMFIGAIIAVVSDSSGAFKAGAVIYNLGITGLGGILFFGAFSNNKLETNIRMGMIISAGLILALGFITQAWSLTV